MDTYAIWFNLKDTSQDLAFVEALEAFLSRLRDEGAIEAYRLRRRKLGFGPDELGEFFLCIETNDLAQLDEAFGQVAPRTGDMETAHARVWSAVTDFRSGLYRDFPDPVRVR